MYPMGLNVLDIGSFHVGGTHVRLSGLPPREVVFAEGSPPIHIDPNGDFQAGQAYVHYVRLMAPRARYPLLMWHGGALSGAMWETTPDGRPGWQMFFLNAGHDVYVSDAVERGRASWARYPEIFKGEPLFRSAKEAWELLRIGPIGSYSTDPAKRHAHPGGRFPVVAFDQFTKQLVPRWVTNATATQAAYDALVARLGPCVLIVHSQGAEFAFRAALSAPEKVKGLVGIEPSAVLDLELVDLRRIAAIPHLFVWGDYLDTEPRYWAPLVPRLRAYGDALSRAGVAVEWIDLPASGIRGNSHMLMMEENADEIAGIIQNWMTRYLFMR
jgi:pimeloyl-ACP methyl ester carboxylesterase